MESRVSNLESKIDEFQATQEELKSTQNSILHQLQARDLILHQLQSLMARCNGGSKYGGESSAATLTHQPFIKMTSLLSLEKSNQVVLKLQSFHKEKVRAREEVDEFLSQYRPKFKPKSPPCLRPILKRFKKVRDYGQHHDNDSATFRSNPRFQVSFGFSLKALAGENEKVFDLFDKEAKYSVNSPPFLDSDCRTGTTNDLVSGFPVSDCEFIGMEKKVAASKLLAKKGEDSLLCDVGLCSFPKVGSFPEVVLISVAKSGENDAHHVFVGLPQTVDIASLKHGFHEFTRDKGGTTSQRLFHSKSVTVLESDCKNGRSQVFILEIHVSNVEFKKAKLPGSCAFYLFDKMLNSGYILDIKMGYHMSIRDKGGTNFLFSSESIDLRASCKDSDFCVVIDRSMGYDCKGIRDKGGTISQRLFNSKSKNKNCVLGSDCSKVFKCEVSFDPSMIIAGEDAGNLGLHHLEACMDKNRKNEKKFTLSRFETGCCVVCYVVLDRDYCKGIRDKGGGKLEYGLRLFEKMRIQDVVSWTSIITTYVWTGQEDRAIKAFIRMQEAGVSPNEYTFAGVISRVANLARVEWGEQLHAHVLHRGLISSLSVGNSIVTMYAKCGRLASGSKVFHEMSRRDIVSWSTLIAGYSQGGYEEEALQFSSCIRRDRPKPNEFALTSVLSVCGSMAMLEQGTQLHAHVLSVGLEFTSMVQSALVNLYSKHGSIKEAAKICDVTELSDIISGTATINGYAEHGFDREAIDLFMKIPRVGLKPYSVTFIGILVPCCHAGLVDLGFHYNSMSNDFGIMLLKENGEKR